MQTRGATLGLFDPTTGRFVLCDQNETAPHARSLAFGPFAGGLLPVAGDWNGDGLAGLGLYSPETGVFRLRDTTDDFIGHRITLFGPLGGRPVVGDWTGRGADGLGVYDANRGVFFLRNEARSGEPDMNVTFGDTGEELWPIAGRFSPDAPLSDTLGLYNRRLGVFHLKTSLEPGPADLEFGFGPPGQALWPVVGDWIGQGYDTIGLVDPFSRVVYLRYTNDEGGVDAQFAILDDSLFGGDWHPVAGRFAGVHGEARPRSEVLDADGRLRSQLWVDQPKAVDEVAWHCEKRGLGSELAVRAREFIQDGFTVLHLPDIAELVRQIEADVEVIWRERPADLLVVQKGAVMGVPFAELAANARARDWRIPDLHSHSKAALALYLSDALFEFVELLFDEPAVAIQSLYFERGSEQGLHRDPMFVATTPTSHLVAAWIALEDVTVDCGPLVYLPGSHRLPYVETVPGGVALPQDAHDPALFDEVLTDLEAQSNDYALEKKTLVCNKGDVLIWHGSLFHGGAPVTGPDSTRKSFVVHYSTLAHYPERINTYEHSTRKRLRRTSEVRVISTRTLLGEGGARGLDNPMRAS